MLWFRKSLRLHDSPALLAACDASAHLCPVFVMDPKFANPARVGAVRYRFLLESLRDLDKSLQDKGSRLLVARGAPEDVVPRLVKEWRVGRVVFEKDSEPYAVARDEAVKDKAEALGATVKAVAGHTLHDLDKYKDIMGDGPPKTYASFRKLFDKVGKPAAPESTPDSLPGCPDEALDAAKGGDANYDVPTLGEMGYDDAPEGKSEFPGGETEALKRLERHMKRKAWVAGFQKPKTDPTTLEPNTTGLSPYLKFGCLSPRTFWHAVQQAVDGQSGATKPPESLQGQLLWREFNYLAAATTPNWGRMVGNPACRQIPWDHNDDFINAWREGRTGYPWIDAIQKQLHAEGWLHHLARHATACFLTRGDLWQSWEVGQQEFEKHLIDADWSINGFNWLWLSCSGYFYQYFRVYSPIAFAKKYDPSGKYVRKYLPVLRKLPDKYIYEPWKAPKEVQKKCGCVVGEDYPVRS